MLVRGSSSCDGGCQARALGMPLASCAGGFSRRRRRRRRRRRHVRNPKSRPGPEPLSCRLQAKVLRTCIVLVRSVASLTSRLVRPTGQGHANLKRPKPHPLPASLARHAPTLPAFKLP
jgi:hypothetical protein